MMIRVLDMLSVTSLESNSSVTVPMVFFGIVAPVTGLRQLQLLAVWRKMVPTDHVPKNTTICNFLHCDFFAKHPILNRDTDCPDKINEEKNEIYVSFRSL